MVKMLTNCGGGRVVGRILTNCGMIVGIMLISGPKFAHIFSVNHQVLRIHTGTAIGAEIPPIWGP